MLKAIFLIYWQHSPLPNSTLQCTEYCWCWDISACFPRRPKLRKDHNPKVLFSGLVKEKIEALYIIYCFTQAIDLVTICFLSLNSIVSNMSSCSFPQNNVHILYFVLSLLLQNDEKILVEKRKKKWYLRVPLTSHEDQKTMQSQHCCIAP